MLTSADVMTTSVVTISPEIPVPEVAPLLQEHSISVVGEGELIGHAGAVGNRHHSW
jgi:CBS domain-containing protein